MPTAGSTVPLGSTISFEATTGSYINGQLDISSLQVELDGIDITGVTQLDIDYDFSLQEDRDFEVLRPSFSLPLTPGTHTVSVRIDSIRGWNETSLDKSRSTERTWSFEVVEGSDLEDALGPVLADGSIAHFHDASGQHGVFRKGDRDLVLYLYSRKAGWSPKPVESYCPSCCAKSA